MYKKTINNQEVKYTELTDPRAQSISQTLLKILSNKQNIRNILIKRFPHIIIDECQDLSPMQLVILDYLVHNGLKIYFVGDLNQSIYKFREVDPQQITKFIITNKLINLRLSNNFRSNH